MPQPFKQNKSAVEKRTGQPFQMPSFNPPGMPPAMLSKLEQFTNKYMPPDAMSYTGGQHQTMPFNTVSNTEKKPFESAPGVDKQQATQAAGTQAKESVAKKKQQTEQKPPSMILQPRPNPQGVQFGDPSDPLQKLLADTWATVPDDWKGELSTFPPEILKAYLFFLHAGKSGVLFRDQFIPGELAAQKILQQVRDQRQNEINYNNQIKAQIQSQQQAKQQQQRQEDKTLPFRPTPKFF